MKVSNILRSRIVQVTARLILGGIFIYASVEKIAYPVEFAKNVQNYNILPGFSVADHLGPAFGGHMAVAYSADVDPSFRSCRPPRRSEATLVDIMLNCVVILSQV